MLKMNSLTMTIWCKSSSNLLSTAASDAEVRLFEKLKARVGVKLMLLMLDGGEQCGDSGRVRPCVDAN